MHENIATPPLKKALGGDWDTLLQEVADAVNQAQPGRIIADSEGPVHQATAVFRGRLYPKALQLRQPQSQPAFSPCAP
jgi:hypothetical protein